MRSSTWCMCLLMSALMVPMVCAEETALSPEQMIAGIQQGLKNYDIIQVNNIQHVVDFDVTLGAADSVTTVHNGDMFDGFRFTVPKDFAGEDFIWYFNSPSHWGRWYISHATDAPAAAFKRWHTPSLLYQKIDTVEEKSRSRFLQSCDGSFFKAGEEYIMWFNKVSDGGESYVRGRFTFSTLPKDEKWGVETLEEHLALTPLSHEKQIQQMGSVGGEILLDKDFFSPHYAQGRIDSLFSTLRVSKSLGGGFFVSMRTFVPPCKKSPTIAEIEKKYGPAHFIQGSQEALDVMGIDMEEEGEEQEENKVTYYYDHFGFEVLAGDAQKKVVRVSTQEDNFSSLSIARTLAEKPTFVHIRTKNLTVFFKDQKEVGRLYFFNESEKPVLVAQDPAVAVYSVANSTLAYKGNGVWEEQVHYEDGSLARTTLFENHRMHGACIGSYEDGTKRFELLYKNGVPDGDLREYAEDGSETSHRVFKNGIEQEKKNP